jgi:dihydrofolate synthase/folylpolyglutamate synthase
MSEPLSEPRLPDDYKSPYLNSLPSVCYTYLARIKGFSGLKGFKLNDELARVALKKSVWPGRMQILRNVVLDGAHNPDAAKVLVKCLKEKKFTPLPCIFASLADKDTFGVLKILKPYISVCYPVRIEEPRARSVEEICGICEKLKIKAMPLHGSIGNYVRKSKSLVLITGSLYLVGKAITQVNYSL